MCHYALGYRASCSQRRLSRICEPRNAAVKRVHRALRRPAAATASCGPSRCHCRRSRARLLQVQCRLRTAPRGRRALPPSARRAAQVGHNALGAGQVVDQGARLCDRALESHRLWDLDGWKYLAPAVHAGGTLHFIGLLSDGGVHSRYDQLLLLLTGVRAPRSASLPASGLAGPLSWARALQWHGRVT